MRVTQCRLCGEGFLQLEIKFPQTPLANEFLQVPRQQELFDLELMSCQACGHYQLSESIDPKRLFSQYVFVAGTSPVNVEHFRQYAENVVQECRLSIGSKVLDIASNDGILLRHFKDLGMEVLGIDPASNIAQFANQAGIPTLVEFFNNESAKKIVTQYGKFDIVTANNVFAHVPDLLDFVKGVQKVLVPRGMFIFEVSYFLDVCEKTLVDTLYHEHSSYHTLTPLKKFFDKLGMQLWGYQRIPTHGGSIRVWVKNIPEKSTIDLSFEDDIKEKVKKLSSNIVSKGNHLRNYLEDLKYRGKKIAIYGFPAKATTLFYCFGLDPNWFDCVIEDNPLKQKTFTPGYHLPVYSPDFLKLYQPDVFLILAWNFADSILKKYSDFKGTWIIPLPEFKEINAA